MTEPRFMSARAYRDGRLVCDRAQVIMIRDDRIGLAPAERRHATVRFLDPPARSLGHDLANLVRRRGAAARRAAEQIEPIQLVLDAPGGPRRVAGRLEPPTVRFGALRDIEFGIRVWP